MCSTTAQDCVVQKQPNWGSDSASCRTNVSLYTEFLKQKNKCKFSNCLHVNEPSCQIKEMVEKNSISLTRYESYIQILNDDNLKHR